MKRQRVARIAALLILAIAVVPLLIPAAATAEDRATPVDTPQGRYYVYAKGGEFPTGHGVEIWQETNGLTACGVLSGLPVGHVLPPDSTSSGLQVKATTCNGKSYKADTRIFPPL